MPSLERLEQRALLTDLTPPVVVSATPIDDPGGATFSQVKVVFDEAVATPSATNVQNYRLTRPIAPFVAVTSATMDPADVTGKTVVLTVAPQSVSGSYGVHAGGVSDLAGNAGAAIGRNYVSNSTLTFNPISMGTGDYDGDGLLDIAIASNNGYDIWFYKGLGNGDFGTASLAFSSPTQVTRLEPKSADIDGDGKLDLVTYEGWSDPSSGSGIGIYFGNGDGTFQAVPRQTFAPDGVDVEVTDVDNDGDLDILASASYSFRTYLNPHNPLGTAPASQTTVRGFDTWTCVVSAYVGFTQVTDLQIGDVNGDGRSDVVASYSSYPLQIWLGTATPGVFAAPVASIAVATGEENALADLNGDGRLDFISSYGGTIAYGIAGSPYFSEPQATAFGSDAYRAFLSPVDLDGDGDLDLVAGRKTARFVYDRNVYVLYNQGGGNFDSTVTTFDLAGLGLERVQAAQFSDLNGDGLTDVIGLDTSSERFFIMKSQIGASSANFVFSPNNAPTPTAGGPYSIAEGGSLSLSAAGSTDPDGDALTYSWDVNNDGVFGDATGVAPSLTWSQLVALGIADNGSYTIALRATDSRGGWATSTAALTITNTAPTLVISGNSTGTEGSEYVLTLYVTGDPGSDTVTGWTINWGDGTTAQFVAGNPSSVTHIYADNENYTITATATDEDDTYEATNSIDVAVANIVPVITSVNLPSNNPPRTYQSLSFTATATDVAADTLTYSWTAAFAGAVVELSGPLSGNSWSFTPRRVGTYTVMLVVTDEDGGSSVAAERTITVSPADPYQDLIGLTSSGDWVVAVSNGASFNGTWTTTSWGTLQSGQTATGDINGDGLTDVLRLEGNTLRFSLAGGGAFLAPSSVVWGSGTWTNFTVGDVNGDGLSDVMARQNGEWWVALSNGTSFNDETNWVTWSTTNWVDVFLADVDNDRKADLVTRNSNSVWYVAKSNGSAFTGTASWAPWASYSQTWDLIAVVDVNGDGQADVLGKTAANWYVGTSNGTSFTSSLWAGWNSSIIWKDARVGDFNGDGKTDITARHKDSGIWYVATSNSNGSASGPASQWVTWSATANWQDVTVGDFNGDGKADLAGRLNGNWWVSLAVNGDSSVTGFVGGANWKSGWTATYAYVGLGNVSSTVGASPQAASIAAASNAGPSTSIRRMDVASAKADSLALFWSTAKDDERFAAALLSASKA